MQQLEEKQLIESFFKNRDQLIDSLEKGSISKQEYVEMSYEYITSNNLQPFNDSDLTVEKGILNYQIFNTLAKYSMIRYEDEKFKNPSYARKFLGDSDKFYDMKDKLTMKLLEHINYKGLRAYFVNVRSESLNGELFEIVLSDVDRAVFHSMDKRMLHRLRTNNVFEEGIQMSIIDKYVNTKYA